MRSLRLISFGIAFSFVFAGALLTASCSSEGGEPLDPTTAGKGGRGGSGGARAGSGGTTSSGQAGKGGTTGSSGSANGGSSGRTGTGGSAGEENAWTPPKIQGGCDGYATRYWDCCKPHCAWDGKGVDPIDACDSSGTNTVGSNEGSGCTGGGAFTCHSWAPWALNSKVAYGLAARNNERCGRCYQLEFTGPSGEAPGDKGAQALAGKVMIVQVTNKGDDVKDNQFDLMIPGGGVGIYNGCADQWDVDNGQLGEQYGGFLATCKKTLGYNASLDAYKTCVREKCDSVFQNSRLSAMKAACHWFVDWFQVADNPAFKYQEVQCPEELLNKTGMRRNDVGTCG